MFFLLSRRLACAVSLWGVVVALTFLGATAAFSVTAGSLYAFDSSKFYEVDLVTGNYDLASGTTIWDPIAETTIPYGMKHVSFAPIPEPTTALLLTFGLAGLGMRRRLH